MGANDVAGDNFDVGVNLSVMKNGDEFVVVDAGGTGIDAVDEIVGDAGAGINAVDEIAVGGAGDEIVGTDEFVAADGVNDASPLMLQTFINPNYQSIKYTLSEEISNYLNLKSISSLPCLIDKDTSMVLASRYVAPVPIRHEVTGNITFIDSMEMFMEKICSYSVSIHLKLNKY